MATPKVFVQSDNHCKYEGMTKEQIVAAIEQAISTGQITDVDSGFITKIKELNVNNGLSFWVGTQAEYNAIESAGTLAENVLYIISDDTTTGNIEAQIQKIKTDVDNSKKYYEQIAGMLNGGTDEIHIKTTSDNGQGRAGYVLKANDSGAGEAYIYITKDGKAFPIFEAYADTTNINLNDKNVFVADGAKTLLRQGGNIVFAAYDNGENGFVTGVKARGKYYFYASDDHTAVCHNALDVLYANSGSTKVIYGGFPVFDAVNGKTRVGTAGNGRIDFIFGNSAPAYIDSDGSGHFASLYANGVQVTSDREKKENIKSFEDGALNMVNNTKVYDYTMKETGEKHTGIMYDEAPEAVKAENAKAVDLYSMVGVLWKALQELNEKMDAMKQ